MPSMNSLAVEQELINDFVQRESISMRRFGQIDSDEPVSIPFVSTKFFIEQPGQSQLPKVASPSQPSPVVTPPRLDTSSGAPPLPSGRYKKHLPDTKKSKERPITAKPRTLEQCASMKSLSRSKSCGEGRSSEPSGEFNVLSTKGTTQRLGSGAPLIDKSNEDSSGESGFEPPKLSTAGDFKCGALCMYLPGFSSKKKPVQGRQVHHTTQPHSNLYDPPQQNDTKNTPTTRPSGILRVPSFERFDCSSVSSGIVVDHWDEATGSCYFDLPMELIQTCENETDSPVTTAFVFEKEKRKGRRSSRRTSSKASHEMSSRRTNVDLRFSGSTKPSNVSSYSGSTKPSNVSSYSGSTKPSNVSSYSSSPSSSCISPKIRQARDELNAFIEAQSG